MNREAIEARRVALEAQRVELIAQVNATMGAIQDCEYWLAQLPPEEADQRVPESRKLEAVKA